MNTYCFSMDGVHSEQQRRHQAGGPVQEEAAHPQEEHTHHGMKYHVEQVVGGSAQLTEEVVQPEREHSQGSIGFMTALL